MVDVCGHLFPWRSWANDQTFLALDDWFDRHHVLCPSLQLVPACSKLMFWNPAHANRTITRLTAVRRVETRNLSLSFILVPSLRTHMSYSCRCQAKRMYLSLLWRQQWHFWVFISSEGHWTLVPADLQSLLKLWGGFTGRSLKSGFLKFGFEAGNI